MAQARAGSPLRPATSPQGLPRNDDSPSRQLQFELERAFSLIQLHESERQKLHAFNRRVHQQELDAKELAQAEVHKAELDYANARHDFVRQQAEAVLEDHIRKEEEDRRRREEDERRRKEEEEEERERQRRQREEEARRRAEAERKARQEAERKAQEEREKADREARLALYEKAKAAEEEKRRREREEAGRQEREEAERREREEKAKADEQAAKREQAQKEIERARVPAPGPAQSQERAWSADPEIRHKDYLRIHRKLKTFRKDFWENAKKDVNLKPVVGDMRRAMRMSVGQLTDDKVGNRKATERVKTAILKALRDIPSPPVVLNEYLPFHLLLLDRNQTTVPSLVLYLLSIFSKAVINAFVGECAVNTKAAEPVGTLAAQIFSLPELQYRRNIPSIDSNNHHDHASGGDARMPPMTPDSVSLITILICKFHAAAPILFGISGPENTPAGRLRLGWRRDFAKEGDQQKSFVLEQRQYDRLTGLGAGYASLALRNFSKARLTNPFPPINFWQSLAWIVNTEPEEVNVSQLILLKSMLENNAVDRFVLFFGAAAVAALKEALVGFPRKLPRSVAEKPAAKSLALLAETFKKERNFSLS